MPILNLGYTYGPFPKPWSKITKSYNCPSPHIAVDTTEVDSTSNPIDTTNVIPTPGTTKPKTLKQAHLLIKNKGILG
jgi:penicillin-binding protein 1A